MIGEAANGLEAMMQALNLLPDLFVMDVTVPNLRFARDRSRMSSAVIVSTSPIPWIF